MFSFCWYDVFSFIKIWLNIIYKNINKFIRMIETPRKGLRKFQTI